MNARATLPVVHIRSVGAVVPAQLGTAAADLDIVRGQVPATAGDKRSSLARAVQIPVAAAGRFAALADLVIPIGVEVVNQHVVNVPATRRRAVGVIFHYKAEGDPLAGEVRARDIGEINRLHCPAVIGRRAGMQVHTPPDHGCPVGVVLGDFQVCPRARAIAQVPIVPEGHLGVGERCEVNIATQFQMAAPIGWELRVNRVRVPHVRQVDARVGATRIHGAPTAFRRASGQTSVIRVDSTRIRDRQGYSGRTGVLSVFKDEIMKSGRNRVDRRAAGAQRQDVNRSAGLQEINPQAHLIICAGREAHVHGWSRRNINLSSEAN